MSLGGPTRRCMPYAKKPRQTQMREVRERTLDNKSKRIMVIAGTAFAAALIVIIIAVEAVGDLTRKKVDTSEGLQIIEHAEAAEVTAIETKIQNLEEQEKKEEEAEDTRSIKEIFTSAVVMGDSITAGFSEYDILNASSVVAEIGAGLDGLGEQIKKLKEINPQVVFLSYGMNDILSTQGDTDLFIENYKSVIKELQKEVPNTKIFVNSIFPVSRQEREREPAFQQLDEYNKVLREMCDKQQIAYVDNTELVSEQYYEEDGVHFKPDFYPIWAKRMAEVASL